MDKPKPPLPRCFTAKELEILTLAVRGLTLEEIARRFRITKEHAKAILNEGIAKMIRAPTSDSGARRPSVDAHLAVYLDRRDALDSIPPDVRKWREPEWGKVAPGLSCKLLSRDLRTEQVSMVVRLAPGVVYAPPTHAGIEELHLLEGELWINGRRLYPGDYYTVEGGPTDLLVWTEAGCTCITYGRDILR